jgi:hypothetical protein
MKNENTDKASISVKTETKERFLKLLEETNKERYSKGKIYAKDKATWLMNIHTFLWREFLKVQRYWPPPLRPGPDSKPISGQRLCVQCAFFQRLI